MDRLRDDAEAIITAQTKSYQVEQRRLERQSWLTSLALAAGVILCLGVIGWLFTLRGREMERRRQLEGELRALNLELEDRVQERTAEVKRTGDLLNAVVENLPDMILLKVKARSGIAPGLFTPESEGRGFPGANLFFWCRLPAASRCDLQPGEARQERVAEPVAIVVAIVVRRRAPLGRPFLERPLLHQVGEGGVFQQVLHLPSSFRVARARHGGRGRTRPGSQSDDVKRSVHPDRTVAVEVVGRGLHHRAVDVLELLA